MRVGGKVNDKDATVSEKQSFAEISNRCEHSYLFPAAIY